MDNLPATSYKATAYTLQATSYTLQTTSYTLQGYKLQATGYKATRVQGYKLQATSYKLQATSYTRLLCPRSRRDVGAISARPRRDLGASLTVMCASTVLRHLRVLRSQNESAPPKLPNPPRMKERPCGAQRTVLRAASPKSCVTAHLPQVTAFIKSQA